MYGSKYFVSPETEGRNAKSNDFLPSQCVFNLSLSLSLLRAEILGVEGSLGPEGVQ